MENIKVGSLVIFCLLLLGCASSRNNSTTTIDTISPPIPTSCNFEELNSNFNKEKWQSDSLGNSGYRQKYFNGDTCLLRLKKGMSKKCILDYLGSPYKNHGQDLEYMIEEGSMSIVLSFNEGLYVTSSLTFWSSE